MTRKNGLPPRVYLKHGAYYLVTIDRKWVRLCAEKDGLPAMYRALAEATDASHVRDRMPAVIARYLDEKRPSWGAKTASEQERFAKLMSKAFEQFSPEKVTTPVAYAYLKRYAAMPRTFNFHRTLLKGVLAFAALEGLREGYNPVDNIPAKTLKGRKRYASDPEIAAIKVAALLQARNGQALVQMIDLALLLGQRISDTIKIRWQDVSDDGIFVQQGKGDERLLIQWSPALRAAVEACATDAYRKSDRIGFLLKTQSGKGFRYAGIRSAWNRACVRAGIEDLNIHDLRGRAGMDKRDASDLEGARDLLGHKSVKMTEHYVEGKAPKKVTPSR